MLVDEQRNCGLQWIVGRLDLPDLLLAPQNAAAAIKMECVWLCGGDATSTHRQLAGQHLRRSIARRLAVDALGAGVELELETLEPPDEVVFDVDGAVGGELGVQLVLVAHSLPERAGA